MRSNTSTDRTVTLSVIAEELGESRDRIKWILRSRAHIRRLRYAKSSNVWNYDIAVIAMVRYELNAIDARRDHDAEGEEAEQFGLAYSPEEGLQ